MGNNEKNSVLIVDDEEINLEVLRGMLSSDYIVYMAKGGVSALESTDKYMPDLILLDIIMPDMNGFEVLKTLKKTAKTKHIPVIVITSLNSTEDEEKGLKLGAADFISKPFNNTVVHSRVENHMQIVNQIRAIEQYAHNMQLTLSNRLEAIVNNYNGFIWSIDNSGIITYFNGQYVKKMGLAPSLLIGKNIETVKIESWPLNIINNVEKTFREGSQDWLSEIDGVVFRSYTTLTRDDEGNVTGIVGSSDDVTELIKLQRDLQAAVKAAETANRTKSSFLARMSHEIRTPLNAVLGIAEIQLQNKTLHPDEKEVFTRIFNSGNLLLGIINDILDMSKIEAGKLELMQAKYDIASLINDTVYLNMIKHEDKPIDFVLNVDENVPSELFGDGLRIKQILNNLLSNAFKYTKEGEVELSIHAEGASGDTVTLVFRVRDTGQGMTAEQVGRLFDEYSRFNMEANRTTEGTGLGMGITQNLVNMMNGEILVESEAGKGSLFTVRLPQGNIGAGPLGKETVDRLKQFHLTYEAKLEKLHILREPIPFGKVLVVDDLDMNLYVIRGMLSPYGLQIDTALSGHEAIGKIKCNTYDLVFMDHMMPLMDGVETTQKIRKWEDEISAGTRLPVIALTANAVSGMKEMFLANGFNGFVSKPIILHELDEVLKEWLSPEKITPRKNQEALREDETYDSFIKDVGKINEIDTEVGLSQVTGNKAMYRNTLEIFYQKLIGVCNDMTAFLGAKDSKNFAVSVHSMKTMLIIIGAVALSKTALELEIASKNGDIDFCTRLFGEFKGKLLSLHRQLSVIFGDGAESPAVENPADFSTEKSAPKTQIFAKVPSFTGKVLLVDDTEMILYIIGEKLTRYGLQVDTATCGKEAIDKMRNNAYDLVFMDHMMPEMDGIETTSEIRKLRKEYKKLPVIALSANTDPGVEEMFLANGFNGFLSKPIAKEKLEAVFRKWLPPAT
jgi:PAS domain S-box-containing protein